MPPKPSKRAKRGRKAKKGHKKARARASCPIVKKVRRDKLGPWIQREGKLGGPGYTKKAERARHHLLRCSHARFGHKSTLGSLQVLLRNRSMSKKARAAVKKDIAWLKKMVPEPLKSRRGHGLPTIRSRVVQIAKGLSRKEALQRAHRKSRGDYRGFTYDPETGKAVLT